MFDQITLYTITSSKNKNGEVIETETPVVLPAVMQRVDRRMRNEYNERGLGRALRFQLSLFGDGYNTLNVPYFDHDGIRYSVTDFVKDVTGTHYYIEGTTSRGKK